RGGALKHFNSVPPAEPGFIWTAGYLRHVKTIRSDGELVGFLATRTDLGSILSVIEVLLLIGGGVLVLSIVLALIFANRLQEVFTGPLLRLVSVAKAVSIDGDFSRRAQPGNEDEIGALVCSFNDMLATVE